MTQPQSNDATRGEDIPPRRFANNAVQMLRTAQDNTMTLSQMADNKASIMMGATFVVFSISVSSALAQELPWSLTLLALFAFLSSLFAAVAILPSMSKMRKFAPGPQNRLFFGHYTGRDEEEWIRDVLVQMETEEAMYRMMLRDIYQNGQVLARRKYRYLSYSYRLFIVGLALTLVTYIAEAATAY